MSSTADRIVALLTSARSQQDICHQLSLSWDEVQEALRPLIRNGAVAVQPDGKVVLRASVVPVKRGW